MRDVADDDLDSLPRSSSGRQSDDGIVLSVLVSDHSTASTQAQPPNAVRPTSRASTVAPSAAPTAAPTSFQVEWVDAMHQSEQVMNQPQAQLRGAQPSFRSRMYLKLRRLARCLFYPIVVLSGVLTVVTMLIFCVLPGMIIISIFLCCYYCCARDPAPLSIWMIQLFGDDEDANRPRKSRQEMEAMLVTRRVLAIEACPIKDEESNHHDNKEEEDIPELSTHRTHAGKVQLPSSTGDRRIVFSERLACPAKVDDTNTEDEHDKHVKNNNNYDDDDDNSLVLSDESENETPQGVSGASLPSKTSEREKQQPEAPRATTSDNDDDDDNDNNPHHRANKIIDFHDQERPSSLMSVQHSQAHAHDVPCCDICLVEYQKDDLVCWSTNANCVHAFHHECILDWLERKPNCPNCRRLYLVEPNATNGNDRENASPGDSNV